MLFRDESRRYYWGLSARLLCRGVSRVAHRRERRCHAGRASALRLAQLCGSAAQSLPIFAGRFVGLLLGVECAIVVPRRFALRRTDESGGATPTGRRRYDGFAGRVSTNVLTLKRVVSDGKSEP